MLRVNKPIDKIQIIDNENVFFHAVNNDLFSSLKNGYSPVPVYPFSLLPMPMTAFSVFGKAHYLAEKMDQLIQIECQSAVHLIRHVVMGAFHLK